MEPTFMEQAEFAEMKEGENYFLIYRLGKQTEKRCAVLGYLGQDETKIFLDARPIAGTQSLPKDSISRIERRGKADRRFLNKVMA